MFRSILVPLDGSANAEQGLALASWIALKTGAELRLVHVRPAADYGWELNGEGEDAEVETAIRSHLNEYLGIQARRLLSETGQPVAYDVVDGLIVNGILESAADTGADLIVLTAHGQGGLAHAWLGSVAEGVIRQAVTPVLLIRPRVTRIPAAEFQFRQVLVPIDGSPESEEAIEPALHLARATGASITLLAVVKLSPAIGDATPGADEAAESYRRAENYLKHLAAGIADTGASVHSIVRESLHPAMTILEVAAELDVDLIALATHGRSRLHRLLVGSVSDKILRGSSSPVLLVRPLESSRKATVSRAMERAST